MGTKGHGLNSSMVEIKGILLANCILIIPKPSLPLRSTGSLFSFYLKKTHNLNIKAENSYVCLWCGRQYALSNNIQVA